MAETKENKTEELKSKIEKVRAEETAPAEVPKEKTEATAEGSAELIKKVSEAIPAKKPESLLEKWVPKTQLGKEVFEGKVADIHEVLRSGRKIIEPEIVDKLVPELKNELILIGGRTGKGGGIQRIPVMITSTMHKSGRRFSTSAFVVVGNEDGLVGIGRGVAPETRDAIAKAVQKAKLNLISIKRGCGSWECGCETTHSVPYKVKGKSGSVRVVLLPAPKGVGLVADDESKKILRLAGIKDVWVKTFGNTGMRINLISAIFNALKKIYIYERSG